MSWTSANDIEQTLEQCFQMVYRERMHDVPIVNHDIGIHALGFQQWQSYWIGVLVTPWFMNLILIPGEEENWDHLPELSQHTHTFPSGNYQFTTAFDEQVGKYQMCSLFSPMFDFAEDAAAVETAEEVIKALMQEENREVQDIQSAEIERIWRGDASPEQVADESSSAHEDPPTATPATVSRRQFLTGKLAGGEARDVD